MHPIDTLDVLVVYSAGAALSASIEDSLSTHPFLVQSKQSNYNLSYAYFLETCQKYGIKAGFTNSSDIIGPGTCSCYWVYRSDRWVKVNHIAKSTQIFDKLSPTSTVRAAERQLLLSDKAIKPFNDIELFGLFFDKLLTYKRLAEFAIPTVSLRSSNSKCIIRSINKLQALLQRHAGNKDFTKQIILKDRHGSGGYNVYKIDQNFVKEIRTIMLLNPEIQFVIQPFLLFDKGYTYKNNHTATDIRLIFHNNRLLQCYVRMARNDEFRCNEHQGGELVYVSSSNIPTSIHVLSAKITKRINKPRALYALDFVMSNTEIPYFLEGNTGPGLDWDIKNIRNERMSKQLINSIVKALFGRVVSCLSDSAALIDSKSLIYSDRNVISY